MSTIGDMGEGRQHMCQPVGLAEIAERLGVQRNTAKQWHQRKLLPEPGPGLVSGAPWWPWERIEGWARESGRLSD
jgi:hypothetical protein